MILIILGFITGLYTYTSKIIQNEPLKSHFSNLYVKINKDLIIYGDRNTSINLKLFSDTGNKALCFLFVACILVVFLPKRISQDILVFLSSMLLIIVIFKFSIEWIQMHRKSIKKHIINSSFLVIYLHQQFYLSFQM